MWVNARSVVGALTYRPDQLQVVLMLVTSVMSRAMGCQSASYVCACGIRSGRAVVGPCVAQCGVEARTVAACVEQRRVAQNRARVGAPGAKSRAILGQPRGNRHEFAGIRRDPLSSSRGAQQAHANARAMTVALKHHHRHAHPQRLAGSGGSVVRRRVKRNMDAAIKRKVIDGLLDVAESLDARGINAARGDALEHAPLRRWISDRYRLEQKPRVRNRGHHRAPQANGFVADLRGEVERTKGDRCVLRRHDRFARIKVRLVAKEARIKSQQPLGAAIVGARRIGDRIDHAPIDLWMPRRIWITDRAHNNGRGFAIECGKPTALGVSRKFNENINALFADRAIERVIAEHGALDPRVGHRAESFAHRTVQVRRSSRKHHDRIAIALAAKDRLGEVAHRVLAQVARHDADAQRSIGVRVGRRRICNRATRVIAVSAVRGGQFLRIDAQVVEREGEFGEKLLVRAAARDCVAQLINGLGHAVAGFERGGGACAHLGPVWAQFESATARIDRGVGVLERQECDCKTEVSARIGRVKAHGGAEVVDRVLVAAGAHQRVAKIVAIAGDIGSDGHRPLELHDRLLRLADLGQEEPEHLHRVNVLGLNPQQCPH